MLGEVAFDSHEQMKRLATRGKTFLASNVNVVKSGTLDGVALYFEAILLRGDVGKEGKNAEELAEAEQEKDADLEQNGQTKRSQKK